MSTKLEQSGIIRLRRLGWVMTALLLLAALSACAEAGRLVDQFSATRQTETPAPTATPPPVAEEPSAPASASPGDGPSDAALIDAAGLDMEERRIVDVYEHVAPSVVSITTRVLRRNFFFEAVPEEGAGSGFVLDRDGHILTNYHVVADAERIEVNFGEDTVYTATVVGLDKRNDIAVLHVDAPDGLLQPVELGSSANLSVGQRAIAIGNPFGQFGRTLTTGVISALGRTLEGQDGRTITGVIQSDAAINRGNSGGPLLDSSGRVIGINTAIFSPTGASAGVGFAVPVDTVHRVLPDLLALGRYRHPWLGIRYAYAVTPGFAEILKLPVAQGLLLVQMYDNAPLLSAGVRGAQSEAIIGNQRVYVGGDILLAVNGQEVGRLEDLETLLEDNYRVGDVVTVKLLRDGNEFEAQLELIEEPS